MAVRIIIVVFCFTAFASAGGCITRAGPSEQPGQSAPVDARAAALPKHDAQLQPCERHDDCSKGSFCRDRGDNIKLCMGRGGRGDHCTDTIDCREPLFCQRQRRKLRLCM